jgi:hypothetical protein
MTLQPDLGNPRNGAFVRWEHPIFYGWGIFQQAMELIPGGHMFSEDTYIYVISFSKIFYSAFFKCSFLQHTQRLLG